MNENRLSTLPLSGTPSPAKVSHLYHLGAKQFYLDREKPLALSDEQRTRLRRLWEFDQEEKLRYRDSIAGKEREIWWLTGAEVVPLQAVERLVREVERLKADRRVSFIRRVREAAEVLTLHQREMLNRVKGGR